MVFDYQGKILFFNTSAEHITGYSSSSITGAYMQETFPDSFARHISWAAAPNTLNHLERECQLTRVDGSSVVLAFRKIVLQNSGMEFLAAILFRDISEQHYFRERALVSENQYHRIFEGSKDLIFMISPTERIEDINYAGLTLLGYANKSDLLDNVPVERIFYNSLHWKVFKKQLDRHGAVRDFEASFRKKDGINIHCLLSGNANLDRYGQIIGYEAIAKDVTARMDADRALKQRHRESMILNAIAFSMNINHDLGEILQLTLNKMLDVFKLRTGAIYLIDQHAMGFSLQARQGMSDMLAPHCTLKFHDERLKGALLNRNNTLPPYAQYPPFRVSIIHPDGKSNLEMVCFLISKKEQPVGFFAFHAPFSEEFSEQGARIIASVGNFLAGFIEKYNLSQAVHKHREELKNLTAQLFHSQEWERRRISRELHDEVGQALTGINFLLDSTEKEMKHSPQSRENILEVKKQINHTYQEMRRISHCLHPSLLHDLGLEAALENYFRIKSEQCDLSIDFSLSGLDARMPEDFEIALYRISQEAFTNCLNHAKATQFVLSIVRYGDNVLFMAKDNGVGFDYNNNKELKNALGILSMRERVAVLNGTFSLDTSPGQGLRIQIELPIYEPRASE